MSSKDKENKSVQEKLKQLFRLNKTNTGSIRSKDEFFLTEEIQRDLSKESPIQTRIKAVRELCEAAITCKLNDETITKIWCCIQDLPQENSPELRHLALNCLQFLITGQNKNLSIFRAQIFRVIAEHKYCDDLPQRLILLQSLTENGKDILYFEEKIAPFLLNLFPDVTKAGKVLEFIQLLINLIKFNAAYINEECLTGFVGHICVLCCSTQSSQIVINCLQILDTIVAYYRNLPSESLPQFVGVLCRMVNNENYCTHCWRVMRNLLGTHLGHSAIFTMCRIFHDPGLKDDVYLLRGAVFYINIALWGTQPISNLRCPPSSVLPSILSALETNHSVITFEVALSVQNLIGKYGIDLQDPTWDILIKLLSIMIKQMENERNSFPQTGTYVHETLTNIENLIEAGNFNGNVQQFYDLIEACAQNRPENSLMRLIGYLAEELHPNKNGWLNSLCVMMAKYYKFEKEKRTNVRLKVLDVLSNVIQLNRWQYEDELIDHVVIPHLVNLSSEQDYKIRSAGAALLIDLCLYCETKRCMEMLDILERLLNRPFEVHNSDTPATDLDTADVKAVVAGLIKVFVVKIHKLPSLHAVRIYKILVNHLDMHYNRPKIFENCNYVRIKIFECFLKMRADTSYRLGCPDQNNITKFSPYLCVTYASTERNSSALASPPPTSPAIQHAQCTITYVPMKPGFKIFITCLGAEKDWDVLNSVLNKIPDVLQNKSLILAKSGNDDIGLLVDRICTMINNFKSIPDALNANINRSDFFASVLMVLSSLASYHAYLDPLHQQKMIRLLCTFKFGLGLKCFRQCMNALTTCTLEMQDVMVKMFPEVLLILSKSSATVHIAIHVLEFLSTLTILPAVYSCFVADQYMAIFAILLPYTNPFKYNHYTVFLAHHVIAVWFLKCRLPFRRDFVRFITNGLQTNALTPFEESLLLKSDLNKLNQDSSDRKRSSSLTEQRSTRRERASTVSITKPIDVRPKIDNTLISFYTELTETCIDLMARYTFSPCSALPRRMPNAEFLLGGGQSMSWLLGNKVVTITTSGCSQKTLKHGLCDKCWATCKSDMTRNLSNEKDDSTRVTRQNSESNNNTSASSPILEDGSKKLVDRLDQLPNKLQQLASVDGSSSKMEKHRCACWCQGWAEIYIRRPTGDMSWIMRIQNQTSLQNSIYDFPVNEISTMFMPSLNALNDPDLSLIDDSTEQKHFDEYTSTTNPISILGSPNKHSPSRQSSRDSMEDDMEEFYEDGNKMRNPVRRSNSSPEMSANWKNPFLLQKQERDEIRSNVGNSDDMSDTCKKSSKNNFTKDMRVSCEAIPEEIAGMGTTPPSQDSIQHPSLLTSLSCPAPSQKRPSNLPSLNLPLTGKPPQSPTQTSPRLQRHEIQKSQSLVLQKQQQKNKSLSLDGNNQANEFKRDRLNTIAVMSPVRKQQQNRHSLNTNKETPKSGINPSFVFLQLYHAAQFGNSEKPLLINNSSDVVQRALKVLDCIPPYETHQIGVLYIGQGQCNKETEILRNRYGSVRYVEFLRKIGTLIKLQDVDPQVCFLGSLEQGGGDGKFAYVWQDDVIRVLFHVATLMPNKDSDPNCNSKKAHIGNNNVTIVYNESGEDYNINTIKGQFNFASIIIQPLDHNSNKVTVKAKDELMELIGNSEPKIVSDENVALLARQLALHANLAALVHSNSLKNSNQDPYAPNWLERLRRIKTLRKKIQQESKRESFGMGGGGNEPDYSLKTRRVQMDDFTEYTSPFIANR